MASPLALPDTWDLVAADYAKDVAPVFAAYARRAMELTGLPHAMPGLRLVDVAAGPGTLALEAARRGAVVTAVDFAPEMVALLRAALSDEAHLPVAVHQADGQALPLDDGSFDAAFSLFGLMFFPDRARGLSELRRVLRPGGVAAFSSWVPMDDVPFLNAAFSALRELIPGLPPPPPSLPLCTTHDCVAEMEAGGFVDVRCVAHTETLPSAEAGPLWERMTHHNAMIALLRRRLGPEQWAPISREISARLVATFGHAPVAISMTALITHGAVPT